MHHSTKATQVNTASAREKGVYVEHCRKARHATLARRRLPWEGGMDKVKLGTYVSYFVRSTNS